MRFIYTYIQVCQYRGSFDDYKKAAIDQSAAARNAANSNIKRK